MDNLFTGTFLQEDRQTPPTKKEIPAGLFTLIFYFLDRSFARVFNNRSSHICQMPD